MRMGAESADQKNRPGLFKESQDIEKNYENTLINVLKSWFNV
jgi:hypothetical protein